MEPTTVLLFDRGGEDLVARARTATAKVVLKRLSAHSVVERVVVATPEPAAWKDVDYEVYPDPGEGEWSFGRRFGEILEKTKPGRVLYLTSGSGLLLEEADWARILEANLRPPLAILNNFFSTDFALIQPPLPVPDLPRDNPLGTRLWQAGYACYELPRCAATQLDIDTPGELQLLALHPELPKLVQKVLEDVPTARSQALLDILVDPEAEVVLAGRISGHLLRFLDQEAACRFRVISEERGMEASGRAERGAVQAILGKMGDHLGPRGLVRLLSQMGEAVVWDTRVMMAHLGVWPSPEERYACDLLQYQKVREPRLKELVQACAESPVPFLLGGHSLVSGGMYLAVELAWRGRDREPRFRPLPFPG